jgi:hypothetical protein
MQPTYLFTGVTVCKSGMGPAVLNALQDYPLLGLRLAKQPHADVVMFNVGKSHDQSILEQLTRMLEFTHPVMGIFPEITLSLITNNPQKAMEIYAFWQT